MDTSQQQQQKQQDQQQRQQPQLDQLTAAVMQCQQQTKQWQQMQQHQQQVRDRQQEERRAHLILPEGSGPGMLRSFQISDGRTRTFIVPDGFFAGMPSVVRYDTDEDNDNHD